MKRIVVWTLMFFVAVVGDQARSAESRVSALESCFKASRLAYAICSNPDNSPQTRLDCFHQAQAEQLVCLEHVSSSDVTGAAPAADPATTGSPQGPAKQPTAAAAPAPAQATAPVAATAPPEVSPVAVSPAAPAASPPPAVPAMPGKMADAPAKEPRETTPSSEATTAPPAAPPVAVAPAAPTAIVKPTAPAKVADTPVAPSNPNWVVSETSSPIDYSPVIVATIKSSTNREDSPGALSIQCRQRRTEIALRTDGAWRSAPNNKVQVALQMKDRTPWNLSADGKTATNVDQAADLIQSLSEGTTMIVTVSDGIDHAAVFTLTGLDAVRKKVLKACGSTPIVNSKASMVKR
jgi:hypothetical protein